MYARLWWKDARQLGSIWLGLALSAGVTEWLVLNLVSGARDGALVLLAMTWAWLYALAVGAAAFAGERETGTLRFLDTLPVSRWTLWAGKVSFALVSTAALASLLLGLAVLHTDRVDRVMGEFNREVGVLQFAGWLTIPVVFALALGLFWSSFTKTALTAAILSAVCASIAVGPVLATVNDVNFGEDWRWVALFELLGTLILLAISDWWVTRPDRGQHYLSRWVMPVLSPRVRVDVVEETSVAMSSERMGRGYSRKAVPVLIGKTVTQGFPTWLLLGALGVLVPLLLNQASAQGGPIPTLGFVTLAALGAGVAAFQAETRDRTHRFLAQHGLRPGVVWAVKVSVWLVGLIVIGCGSVVLVMTRHGATPRTLTQGESVLLVSPLPFAVGVLAGMSARRGITAVLVSVLATIALGVALTLLVQAGMLPGVGVLAVPPVLLFVSWAWSGDWLLDRPAPGRWVRLGLLLTLGFLVLFGIYAPYRVLSMPDVPALAPPLAWSVPLDRNAAVLYRGALQALDANETNPRGSGGFSTEEWELSEGSMNFLQRNTRALELARSASLLPNCQFFPTDQRTLFNGQSPWRYVDLARLAGLSAADRRVRGDLPGAWSEIVVVFRIARHLAQGSTISDARLGLLVEQKAIGLAMEWAADSAQTRGGLTSALASYRALPKFPPPSEAIRGEAQLMERTLDSPVGELRRAVASMLSEPAQKTSPWMDFTSQFITTPWEIARAGRSTRWLAADALREAELKPSRRRPQALGVPLTPEQLEETTRWAFVMHTSPLAKHLFPNSRQVLSMSDHEEAGRRALLLVLGLRHWALGHDGAYPKGLDELDQEAIGDDPIDPFSGKSFFYRFMLNDEETKRNEGAPGLSRSRIKLVPDSRVGTCPVVISVGQNGRFDGGRDDDLVFPLPQGKEPAASGTLPENPFEVPALMSP